MKIYKSSHLISALMLFLLVFMLGAGLARPNYGVHADPVVTEGALAAAQELGAVRFKGLSTVTISSDYEIYLGNGGLASGYRSQTNVLWANGSNDISFVYDATNDKLTAEVVNANGTYTTEYTSFSTRLAEEKFGGDTTQALEQLGQANYLQWNVVFRRSPNATVSLRDLELDGTPLGDYEGVFTYWLTWHLTGVDLSSGFTMTGDIVLENFVPAGVNEHNKVDIGFGWTDLLGPETSLVQIDPNPAELDDTLALTALVDDTNLGDSNIASAEYAVDGGDWIAMLAVDANFNSPVEAVVAAVPAPANAGTHQVCVRGTDAAGATGEAACTTLTVHDNLAPTTGSLLLDPSSLNLGEPFTLTLSASDLLTGASPIVSGEYHMAGSGWLPFAASDGSFDSPEELLVANATAPTVAGTYQFCARATDEAGNTSLQACADLEVLDNLPPTTGSLLLDPSSLNLGEPFTLTLSASDLLTGASLLVSGEFQVDSGVWQPMAASDGSFNSSVELLTGSGFAPTHAGTFQVCAQVADQAGNTSLPACADLEVLDNLAPTADSLVLEPALPGLSTTLTVTAVLDDALTGASPIATAEFSLDGGSTWQPMSAADGSFDTDMEAVSLVTLSPDTAGDYQACVHGSDDAGNTSDMICATLSVVDDLAPATMLLAAAPTESGYQVTATADDTLTGGSPITGAEAALDGGSWLPLAAADGAFDSAYEALAQDFPATLEPGSYPVCVRSSDAAGNTSLESCGTLVVPNPEVPDTTGPVVTQIEMTPNTPVTGQQLTFSAQVDDLSTGGSNITGIEYTLDSGTTWLPMTPADGSFSSPVETGQVEISLGEAGDYTMCVRGTDAADNTGSSQCVQFTVSEPEFNLFIPVIQRNNP